MVNKYLRVIQSFLILAVSLMLVSSCSPPISKTTTSGYTPRPENTNLPPTAKPPTWTASPSSTPSSTPTMVSPSITPSQAEEEEWIAFDGGPEKGVNHIYGIKLNGKGLTQLTHTEFFNQFPGWSPDGKSLVFDSFGQYGDSAETITAQLYIMQFTDQSIRRLFSNTSLTASSSSWSPDGKWIAFSGIVHGKQDACDIYKINIETLEIINLTNTPDDSEQHPSWSPDGANIAFVSPSRAENWADYYIYLMDSDGKNPRHLLSDKSLVSLGGPEWSPNGDKIVFTCGSRYDVCMINRDGSNVVRITDGSLYS
jgi:Tol biopolymer transport system component